MAVVYAVVNQKGGVGKTTTAVNLAAYMGLSGAKTLLVDLDPQGNSTSGFGIDRSHLSGSTYEVLVEGRTLDTSVVPTKVANLSLLPATIDLAGADLELAGRDSRESLLRCALEPARAYFDFILIDAPPSLGLLTVNILVAADLLIIPIQTEYYALEGIGQLLRTVEMVQRSLNPNLEIGRVILTMFDNRTRLSQQVVRDVQAYFGDKVSPTIIPRNVRLSEAPSHGAPIALYDVRSRGARAYRDIAEEVLKSGKAWSRQGSGCTHSTGR